MICSLFFKEMEKLVTKNLTKSIGVSNFNIAQLSELLKIARKPIAINQVRNSTASTLTGQLHLEQATFKTHRRNKTY